MGDSKENLLVVATVCINHVTLHPTNHGGGEWEGEHGGGEWTGEHGRRE
jgi:hypothetical protein